MTTPGVWSDARVARLKHLWADGLSCSQIAADLGDGITRNAVIGKVMRLGLDPRRGPSAVVVRNSSPAPRKRSFANGANFNPSIGAPRSTTRNPTRLQAIANGHDPGLAEKYEEPSDGVGVGLMALTNNTCRWPKGDPLKEGFLFCGDPTADLEGHRPYCPFHSLKSVDRNAFRNRKAFDRDAVYAASKPHWR